MGPSPMALGPFAFRALGFGFTDQDLDLQTPWASQNVADRFDALQWTGPKSEAFSIKGVIFAEEFGGQSTLDGLKGAAIAGLPLMLVTGAGRVHGLHVVEAVTEARTFVRADGLARRNGYDIKCKRYHGSGLVGGIGGLVTLFT